MTSRIRFVLQTRAIVALLIGAMSALWIAPAANAQSVILAGSMDNNLTVKPGDTIAVGYEVSLADAGPSSEGMTISVTSGVAQVSIRCSNGTSQTLNVNIPAQSYSVAANIRNWSSSDSIYLGQMTAPSNLCGGRPGTTWGARFTCTFSYICHGNSGGGHGDSDRGHGSSGWGHGDPDPGCCHNVCFRFHCQYNHRGGTFSDKSSQPPTQCISPSGRDQGSCCQTGR